MYRQALLAAGLSALFASAGAQENDGGMPMHHHHMDGMVMPADAPMTGMFGPYAMTRESSGTSWQPDNSPMEGIHDTLGAWTTMLRGMANVIHDHQGGPRGDTQTFSNSMLMFMGNRPAGDGAAGFRLMVSGDPLMGARGYPELFQTGETADGVHALVDRQHPHNLLMEAAGTYTTNLAAERSVFIYGGIAGEPALGPPVFMDRLSGIDNPIAPLSHHWLDSTHVTYGVLTAGYVWDRFKIEASGFNGREPDQNRYNVELRKPDSASLRVSANPTPYLALQISRGRLASPEQLAPNISVRRTTASLIYSRKLAGASSQTTFAWGRNEPQPGSPSNAWLVEFSANADDRHTFFGRGERVSKDELYAPGQALYGQTFTINSISVGYIFDFERLASMRLGVGAMASVYDFPSTLNASYGSAPCSYLVFLRARL